MPAGAGGAPSPVRRARSWSCATASLASLGRPVRRGPMGHVGAVVAALPPRVRCMVNNEIMANVWLMYGQCMVNAWLMYGYDVLMYGTCMGQFWSNEC